MLLGGCGFKAKSYPYPEGHPCRDLDPCATFARLPDGGAVVNPEADAGAFDERTCGECNE